MLLCTLVSEYKQPDVLMGGMASLSSVPQALKAVGPELTEGERKLFSNDAKRLAADEAMHEKLERERAAHLLKMITSTVSYNQQHVALEEHIAAEVKEHREELATMKQERRSMIRGTDGVIGHPQTVFHKVRHGNLTLAF